jgi:hypothetical protein
VILNVKLNGDEIHFELSKPPVRYRHREICLACACAEGETEVLQQQLVPALLELPKICFITPNQLHKEFCYI